MMTNLYTIQSMYSPPLSYLLPFIYDKNTWKLRSHVMQSKDKFVQSICCNTIGAYMLIL